jgi:hypothetical protein
LAFGDLAAALSAFLHDDTAPAVTWVGAAMIIISAALTLGRR